MTDTIISTLGLARRAGRAVYGYETVRHEAMFGQIQLVLTAADLSPRSLRNVEALCKNYQLELFRLPFTMQEMAGAVGKPCGIFAVTDAGFAKSIRAQIQRRNSL